MRLTPSAYTRGLQWVNTAAQLAEEMNHHPDITFTYSQVVISITTHSAGGKVTKKDYEFMKELGKRITPH